MTNETGVPRLVIVQPAERAGVLRLSAPQLVIGHSESADLVIEDQYVSGRHALVTVDDAGEVTLWDLNSTGGTFVNGERVTGGRVLEPGDEVRLADVVARFEAGDGGTAGEPTRDAPVVTVSAPPGGDPPPDIGIVVLGTRYTVNGTVYSPALPGIPGLAVQLVDKNVGGDTPLGKPAQTGSDGSTQSRLNVPAAYLSAHAKTSPDLQVHVSVAAAAGAAPSNRTRLLRRRLLGADHGDPGRHAPGRGDRAAERVRAGHGHPGPPPTLATSAGCRRATAGRTSPTWRAGPNWTRASSRSPPAPASSASSPRPRPAPRRHRARRRRFRSR